MKVTLLFLEIKTYFILLNLNEVIIKIFMY